MKKLKYRFKRETTDVLTTLAGLNSLFPDQSEELKLLLDVDSITVTAEKLLKKEPDLKKIIIANGSESLRSGLGLLQTKCMKKFSASLLGLKNRKQSLEQR